MERLLETRDGGLHLSLDIQNNTLTLSQGEDTEVFEIEQEQTEELASSFPGTGAGRLFMMIAKILYKRLPNSSK